MHDIPIVLQTSICNHFERRAGAKTEDGLSMKAINLGEPAPASGLYEQVELSERVVPLNRATTAPRYTRRLSDKILIAFHHACDQGDLEVGEQLLHVLEMMLTRRPLTPDGNRRRNMEGLVAAHQRLWHLQHPSCEEEWQPRATREPALQDGPTEGPASGKERAPPKRG